LDAAHVVHIGIASIIWVAVNLVVAMVGIKLVLNWLDNGVLLMGVGTLQFCWTYSRVNINGIIPSHTYVSLVIFISAYATLVICIAWVDVCGLYLLFLQIACHIG
jgi:hypothetical protein